MTKQQYINYLRQQAGAIELLAVSVEEGLPFQLDWCIDEKLERNRDLEAVELEDAHVVLEWKEEHNQVIEMEMKSA